MRNRDREIIDVHLAALLLEFFELVRGQSTDDLLVLQCRKRDERITTQKPLEVFRRRPLAAVSVHFTKGLSKDRKQTLHQPHIMRREMMQAKSSARCHRNNPTLHPTNATSTNAAMTMNGID